MVDPSVAMQAVVLVVLLFLSAFFSSAETALTTVNKIRLKSLAEDGNRRAITAMKVTDNSAKMLSAVLIGNNIVNISASSLATTLTVDVFGSAYIAYATGLLTLLVLIFGEITPKTMATVNAEKVALRYASIIYGLMWLFTPIIFVVNKLTSAVLFILRVDPNAKKNAYTENEIRTIVEESHEVGEIAAQEKTMINNLFDFGDSQAKDVMIPRIDMTFADVNNTYQEIIDIFRAEKYTRLPVYEDTTDNVIGIINVKDLLLYDSHEEFHVRDILREPYYTYEYKKTSELMEELRKTANNITIVLDEYGATAGMITLEDLLEEIVGDIRDEYDEDEKDEIVQVDESSYLIKGVTKVDDVNEAIGTSLESEDYDSIGGLIIEALDRLPEVDDEVVVGNVRMTVEEIDRNRIETVRVHFMEPREIVDENEAMEEKLEEENAC